MKTIAGVLLLSALSCFGQGDIEMLMALRTPTAAASCSKTDTTNAWNAFIEGFETGSYSNWNLVGTTANITTNYDSSALTTGKPPGACNQCLKVIVPTDGTETYITNYLDASIVSSTWQTDVYFSFYVGAGPPDTKRYVLFHCGTGNNAMSMMSITNNGGQLYVQASATDATTWRPIDATAWYTAKMKYDTAGAAGGSHFLLWSCGTNVCDDAFDRPAFNLQTIRLGGVSGVDSGEGGTYYFDNVLVRTNTP